MKKMKRFLAMTLALVMATAMMAVSASAAQITIQNAADADYTAYQVFEVEKTGDLILYSQMNEWTGFDYEEAGAVASNGYVTDIDNAAAFATKALEYAQSETSVVSVTSEVIDGKTVIDLADGYYVMASPTGNAPFAFAVIDGAISANYGLGSAYVNASTIKEKSGLPTIEKAVDDNKVSIGETLTYTITVTAATGTDTYTITDTLPQGLTDVEVSSTTIDGVEKEGVEAVYDDTDHTITLTVSGDARKALGDYDEVVITYTAKLSEDAVVGDGGNTNSVLLEYGVDLEKKSEVSVYTYQLTINKTDGTNPLAGAGFTLKNGSTAVNLIATAVANTYTVCADDGCIHGTHENEIITDEDGVLYILGLGDGTYTLEETTVPAGYVGSEAKSVTIDDENVEVDVENTPGSPLPETGGIGTTVFYVIGAALMLGAAVVVLLKKQASR